MFQAAQRVSLHQGTPLIVAIINTIAMSHQAHRVEAGMDQPPNHPLNTHGPSGDGQVEVKEDPVIVGVGLQGGFEATLAAVEYPLQCSSHGPVLALLLRLSICLVEISLF